MKDSDARNDIYRVEHRVTDLEWKCSAKDCPVCGHVTLMQRTVLDQQWGFYCYTCGKTFREGTTLTEVKGE